MIFLDHDARSCTRAWFSDNFSIVRFFLIRCSYSDSYYRVGLQTKNLHSTETSDIFSTLRFKVDWIKNKELCDYKNQHEWIVIEDSVTVGEDNHHFWMICLDESISSHRRSQIRLKMIVTVKYGGRSRQNTVVREIHLRASRIARYFKVINRRFDNCVLLLW